ncbi:hypothetical protein AAFF_G00326070 [Aldrovandia affinis]|uniref:Uncharacterized protein n=1 Tax=Aldrovandia affinis TaxID=143900 RepID=A0AAD7X285_9TELE|nr:hypothetical protein AAFF_G00326070 [Aldrovandia affinis]
MIGRFDFIVWRRESGRNLLNSSVRLICQQKKGSYWLQRNESCLHIAYQGHKSGVPRSLRDPSRSTGC